jgi:hypothetical protein
MNRKSHVHAHLAAIVAAVYVSTVLSEAMHGKTVQTRAPSVWMLGEVLAVSR